MSTAPVTGLLCPPRSRADRLGAFVRRDLIRQLRLVESVFFIAVLPTALFLMFGTLSGDWNDIEVGDGNVMATTMTSMALYGAVTATTSIAGSAAVERQLGWGRQLSLTAVTGTDYVVGKIAVALGIAVLPVALVMSVGAAAGAHLDGPGRWAATAALVLLGALPMRCTGSLRRCCSAPRRPSPPPLACWWCSASWGTCSPRSTVSFWTSRASPRYTGPAPWHDGLSWRAPPWAPWVRPTPRTRCGPRC